MENQLSALLTKYAVAANVNIALPRISENKGKQLFQLITSDLVNGKISVDDLSSLCEMVYVKINPDTDLHSLLLMGAEISWYIRHKTQVAAQAIENLIRVFAPEALQD